MRRFVLLSIFCFIGIFSFGSSSSNAQPKPSAPIPEQIHTAKKVFISNWGSTADQSWLPAETPYNGLYAAMKSWGHYELVSAPSDADLVFEIRCEEYRLRLIILDPKTHTVLWAFARYAGHASTKAGQAEAINRALAALAADVTRLVTPPPPAPPTQPKKPSFW